VPRDGESCPFDVFRFHRFASCSVGSAMAQHLN